MNDKTYLVEGMEKNLFIEDSGLDFRTQSISPAITEAVDKVGHMVLKGVPATILDLPNGNERKYTRCFLKTLYLSKEAFFEGLGLYVSPGTSLCLCHCSPRGEATDFACWIISLRLAADAAENCYR